MFGIPGGREGWVRKAWGEKRRETGPTALVREKPGVGGQKNLLPKKESRLRRIFAREKKEGFYSRTGVARKERNGPCIPLLES